MCFLHSTGGDLDSLHWDCSGWNAMNWPASLILTHLTEGQNTEQLCRSEVEQGREDKVNYGGMVATKLLV